MAIKPMTLAEVGKVIADALAKQLFATSSR
jgi:hypothetical protein